jgi:formylglycine-generating enzyme required for sulfatase activity
LALEDIRDPQPGEALAVGLTNNVKLEMVWIAPGEFVMGSPDNESGRRDDEGPQTRVRLSKGYWLGKYQVTQEQWEALMGNNHSQFIGGGRPVEYVTWNEAMEFCKRLTEAEHRAGRLPEGYQYTLPTEAQWEYACRAGTTTRFNTGDSDSDLGRAGWYSANSEQSTKHVGGKAPNAWGLYDMHGNVYEWCADWYGSYPGGSVTDPRGPNSGSSRVIRGGSWSDTARGCRSAGRGGWDPSYSLSIMGFRLALSSVTAQVSLALEEIRGPQAGEVLAVGLPNNVKLEMVWIAPGEFVMGSPSNESGRFDWEGPQTRVRLSKGYWLGKYEVTQAQWQAVMQSSLSEMQKKAAKWWSDQAAAGGYKVANQVLIDAKRCGEFANLFTSSSVGTWGQGASNPMYFVSWNDAMDFCKRLTEAERRAGRLPQGYQYTLPTEAQWEYAARAGTTTRFNTGDSDSDLGRAGWYSANSGNSTKPVGGKTPNAWGLYDMHGNVWEWCADWHGSYPGGSVTDPRGPNSGSIRVYRGGGWFSGARICRSASRYWRTPSSADDNLGFRLALSSVP